MINIIDESIQTIDKLRQSLIYLDAIKDTLEEIGDITIPKDPVMFQIANVQKISAFLTKELHRRECELLERIQR